MARCAAARTPYNVVRFRPTFKTLSEGVRDDFGATTGWVGGCLPGAGAFLRRPEDRGLRRRTPRPAGRSCPDERSSARMPRSREGTTSQGPLLPRRFFFFSHSLFYGSRAYLLADVLSFGSTRCLIRRVRRPERTKAQPSSGRSRTQPVEPHRAALHRCESTRADRALRSCSEKSYSCFVLSRTKRTAGLPPFRSGFRSFRSFLSSSTSFVVALLSLSAPRMRSHRIRSRVRTLFARRAGTR